MLMEYYFVLDFCKFWVFIRKRVILVDFNNAFGRKYHHSYYKSFVPIITFGPRALANYRLDHTNQHSTDHTKTRIEIPQSIIIKGNGTYKYPSLFLSHDPQALFFSQATRAFRPEFLKPPALEF